ncbi:hypothetical protein [Rubripirellula reticaptiva]|uniref:Uncharacterized protein n=1 Tax=Rubripirellula reticaptiva TaxID=2528013 RepID=A0A5C6ELE6_9BACT|nr:hypothetical protein [Rubripirellula reticaptiva]TWU48436.1 hypothetical protein Poly59_52840 [Rubripirellula reticaptiva]
MTQNAFTESLKACPCCGCPLLDRFAGTDTGVAACHCDVSFNDDDAELSEHLILAIHASQFRDNGVETGAICGAISFAIAAMVFKLLPAVWLVWDTQLPWRYFFPLVVPVAVWTVVGALFGGLVLRVLTAILAPTRLVMQVVVKGFFIGFSLGAVIGALCVFIQYVVWRGRPIDDVWFTYSSQVTRSAEWVGLLFAVIGSWVAAILVRSRLDPRLRSTPKSIVGNVCNARNGSTNEGDGRFQFGIAKMLFYTGVIAVMIAVPVQILSRLRSFQRIESYLLAYEVMTFLVVIMLLPFVTWATFRWPKLYWQMRDSLARWRRMDHLWSRPEV